MEPGTGLAETGIIKYPSYSLRSKNEIPGWDITSSLILDTHWANVTPGLAWKNLLCFVVYCRVRNRNGLNGSLELQRSCRTVSDPVLFSCSHGQNLFKVKRSNWDRWQFSSFGHVNVYIVHFYYAYVLCVKNAFDAICPTLLHFWKLRIKCLPPYKINKQK